MPFQCQEPDWQRIPTRPQEPTTPQECAGDKVTGWGGLECQLWASSNSVDAMLILSYLSHKSSIVLVG
jgi:hypothetical protein